MRPKLTYSLNGACHPETVSRSWQARAAQHRHALLSQARAKCGKPRMAPFEPPQVRPVARASANAARAVISGVALDRAAGAPASGAGPGHMRCPPWPSHGCYAARACMTAAVAVLKSPASIQLQGGVRSPSAARPCRLCALWHVCRETRLWATSRPRAHRTAAAQGSLCAQECPKRVRRPRR